MSDRYCACNCGTKLSRVNRSGYARGHHARNSETRRRMAFEREQAEAEHRTAVPEPEEPNVKPVALSNDRLLVLACFKHNAWVEIRDDGQMAPKPGILGHLCPQCKAERERGEPDERTVWDPALAYRALADDEVVAAWRERQIARDGGLRAGTLEEAEVLAEMDEARRDDIAAVERHRQGLRGRRRRGYEPPAFRTRGAGWDLED